LTDARPVRFVLDQGVPRDAAVLLRGLGYGCTHVAEIGMSKSNDEDILAFSLEQRAIVVTLDADFHTILAVSGAHGPSAIRLRLQGLRGPETVALIQGVLAVFEADLKHGCLVTVKPRKTTCHRLPIGGSGGT
jgi:predicted nuclease of predicted toxin-antitoxin system